MRLEPTLCRYKAETLYGFFPRNRSRDDRCSRNDDPRVLSDDRIAIPIKFDNVSRAIRTKRSAKKSASRSGFLFAY